MNYTTKYRKQQLKLMHDLMLNANDEMIYMRWIELGVPDCPTDDDFESIAEDTETYNEIFDLFVELITKKGNRY